MNFSPTATVQSTTSQAVRVSFGGMLLCIFACTLALLRVSRDKTGSETADVREAFETSLQAYGHPAKDQDNDALSRVPDDFCDPPAFANGMRKSGAPTMGLLSPNAVDESAESSASVSDRREFLLLLKEIGRFCDVSPVEQYSGELAFDCLSLTTDSESHLVTQATETIRLIRAESPAAAWDFEVIVWAQAPSEDSLSAAVLKSSRIRDALCTTMTSSESTFCCSGRTWLQKDELSPALTLVARRKLSSSVSVRESSHP